MALREKVLLKKAEKFESKEVQKTLLGQKQLFVLGKVLDDAYAIRRPKPSEYEHREQLIRVFNEIAKELYGNTSNCPVVEAFGSFSMDLFTSESDLDLSVNFRSSQSLFPRDQKIKTLRKFSRKFHALQKVGHVRGVQPILSAKVPILKVVDTGTRVECDLSVENRDGISKSAIIRLITSIDERFQMLSFLMKAWAKAHNINSSKDRTLNSLSIILLVAFHLQTRNPPILPPFSDILKDGEDVQSVMKSVEKFQNYGKNNTETLGELFVSFFVKLASIEKLWPKGLCASTYLGHWTSKTWDTKIANMSVEDFTDRTQNVARAVGKSEVAKVFKCITLTSQKLASFMNGEIEESTLKEYLFAFARFLNPQIDTKRKKRNGSKKRKEIPQNSAMDLRPVSNWPASSPHVGYWGGTHHQAVNTFPNTFDQAVHHHQPTKIMRAAEGVPVTRGWGRWPDPNNFDQSVDHQPTRRMWAAEGVPVTQGWGGWQDWRPAPSGGWGRVPEDPFRRSLEMQLPTTVVDHWGRMLQQPPNGSSSSYGPPLR